MFRKRSVLPFRFACCVALAISAMAQSAPELPKINGESLAGNQVVLPDATAGKVAVLIFGFSKASKVPTSAWAKKIDADFRAQPAFTLYQLPVLQDVPRLIRGMVISGMKKGVAESMRDHFVPILQGEAELKKLVNYTESDDAYLVVLDKESKIVRQLHGAPDDTSYAQLRAEINLLLNGRK
jgi:hypothetical protein